MKKLFPLMVILTISVQLMSQTPQAFKYQTIVRNHFGENMNNRHVSFQIGIIRDSIINAPSYYETHDVMTNEFGLASLNIGLGTPTYGQFDTINWGNDDYHLEIGMDTIGGSSFILMGTTQLLAVPYALYSENTINKDDEDWTRSGDYIYTISDSVGIGTSTPSAKLDVAGPIMQSNTGGSVFIGEGAGYSDDLSVKNNVAIGSYALFSNTDRSGIVAIGDSALFNNSIGVLYNFQAVNNTALGSKVLFSNTTGWENTGIGSQALFSNTTGVYNNALGFRALYNNINGSENTAIGQQAMFNNISGDENTAVGTYALVSNTDGGKNTGLGASALNKNSTGSYNTATGNWALRNNTTGEYNTANGYMALDFHDTGNYNCAIGAIAMRFSYGGNYNTAVGSYALLNNNDGNSNVAIGTHALYASEDLNNLVAVGDSALYHNGTGASGSWDGNWNTAVGSKALYDNTTGYSNTSIGFEASMKNTSGNGNTSVGYGALQYNKTGHNNTAIGSVADLGNDYGSSNVIIGSSANLANSSGSQNTIIGTSAGHGFQVHTKSGCVLIGYRAGYSEYGDNKLYIENSNADSTEALIYGEFDNNILALNANVGIGTIAPDAHLDIRGTLNVGTAGNGHEVQFYGNEAGSKMYWNSLKKAFRSGNDIDGTYWHIDSIGEFSVAAGNSCRASGWSSIAMGWYCTATNNTAIALGNQCSAAGSSSFASGFNSHADADYSTAMGMQSFVSGEYGVGIGHINFINEEHAVGIGHYLYANATNAFLIGSGINSSNLLTNSISNSLIVGFNTTQPTLFVGGVNHRIGIGTANPGKQLEISNTEDAWLRIAGDSDNSGGDDGTQNAYLQFTTDGNAEDFDGLIWLENLFGDTKLHFDVENQEVMVFSNGRIGMGTDSPLASVSNSPVLVTDGTKTTAPTGINWQINDYGGYALGVENVATGGSGLLVDAGNNSGTGATVANFVSNNVSLMYIGENGNIGINNTVPARRLHINDVMRLEPRSSAPSGASAGDLYFDSSTSKLRCFDGTTWQDCW